MVRRTAAALAGMAFLIAACAGPTPRSVPSASPARLTSANMRLVANVPLEAPFDAPDSWGTDVAFQGHYAFVGNYGGFTVVDITDPEKPAVVTRVRCPAGQNDISVYGDLLFLSVDEPRGGGSCDSGKAHDSAAGSWEGIRIFDIGDVSQPRFVAAVRTPCGSHTNTLIPGKDAHYLYVSSPGPDPRADGCPAPHNLISIVKIPVADPAAARVVATPALTGEQDAGRFGGCHDITVYPRKNLAAAACYASGLLLDISDPVRPKVLRQVTDHENFSVWHSATFTNDGARVIFTDELGGGTKPMCTTSVAPNKGGDAIYEITPDRTLQRLGLYKIPRIQTGIENCVAHNGALVPVPGRDVLVQAWYQGGVSVVDFSDPARPSEIGYFDRQPLNGPGGAWSAYYYNGYIYASDVTHGLDILKITDPRTDAAAAVRLGGLNAQSQEPF